jgi:hypothetical protein
MSIKKFFVGSKLCFRICNLTNICVWQTLLLSIFAVMTLQTLFITFQEILHISIVFFLLHFKRRVGLYARGVGLWAKALPLGRNIFLVANFSRARSQNLNWVYKKCQKPQKLLKTLKRVLFKIASCSCINWWLIDVDREFCFAWLITLVLKALMLEIFIHNNNLLLIDLTLRMSFSRAEH